MFKKHIKIRWEAMYFFLLQTEISRNSPICARGSLDDDLKLSQRQMPIFVLYYFHVQ